MIETPVLNIVKYLLSAFLKIIFAL